MLEYIEKLRKEPEHKRRKVALIITVSVTALIFVGWAITFGVRMKGGEFSWTASSTDSNVPSIGQTLSTFIENVKKSVETGTSTDSTQ